MTVIRHVKCDRCGREVVSDTLMHQRADKEWASVLVSLDCFDFCPECWRLILDFIHWPKSREPNEFRLED